MLKLQGPNFYFRWVDNGLPLLLIYSAKDLEPHRFNFWQAGMDLPANILFMNNGANDWYQFGVPGIGTTFQRTVKAIRELAEEYESSEILTLGTSMGGYAAIQYGVELGARILAFSTSTYLTQPLSQASILMKHPEKAVVHDLRTIMPRNTREMFLICGEASAVDLISCLQLSSYPGVNVAGLAGIGHHVPTHLNRSGKLPQLLRSFVIGKPELPAQSGKGEALQHPKYVESLYEASLAYRTGELDKALALCAIATEVYHAGDGAYALQAACLNDKGDHKAAQVHAALAVALAPDNQEHPLQLGRSLVGQGESHSAVRHYQRMVERWPQHAEAQLELGMLLVSLGDIKTGSARMKTAERLGFKQSNRHKYFHY
jgi:hypothetical protein